MRFLLAAALSAATIMPVAAADTVQIPATGKAVATATIPDGWTHKVSDGDIEATSGDDNLVVILSTNPKQMSDDDVVKEAKQALGNDLEIVAGSMKTSKDTVNGKPATVTHLDLKTKGADAKVDLTITQIPTNTEAVLVVGVVGLPENEKKHEGEVEAIFKSLKLAE